MFVPPCSLTYSMVRQRGRLVRDPDRCQGYTALADVCEPGAAAPQEARVELCAGDAGIGCSTGIMGMHRMTASMRLPLPSVSSEDGAAVHNLWWGVGVCEVRASREGAAGGVRLAAQIRMRGRNTC